MGCYKNIIDSLRLCGNGDDPVDECGQVNCVCHYGDRDPMCRQKIMYDAADAIEELLRVCEKMHTWIFLHTTDEQAAYDEIGLTDEQNAMFGYSGQMILKAEPPKGVE